MMQLLLPNFRDWYWYVQDTESIYSSARNIYVPENDAAFVSWSYDGARQPRTILNEADLWDVLQSNFGRPSWLFNGITFVQPTAVTYTKVQLKAYAASKRWEKEIGGLTVSGIPIATDDRSKIMITGCRSAAVADAGWSTIWQSTDGSSHSVNAATMITIANSVQDHITDCFSAYAEIISNVDAGTITTLAQVDASY